MGRVGFSPPGIWELSYPIATRGADYAHHITASPPEFENPTAALPMQDKQYYQCSKKQVGINLEWVSYLDVGNRSTH